MVITKREESDTQTYLLIILILETQSEFIKNFTKTSKDIWFAKHQFHGSK